MTKRRKSVFNSLEVHYQKFATFCARKSVGTRFPIFQDGDIKAEGKLVTLYYNKGSKLLAYPPRGSSEVG